jgi:hypothetical protein
MGFHLWLFFLSADCEMGLFFIYGGSSSDCEMNSTLTEHPSFLSRRERNGSEKEKCRVNKKLLKNSRNGSEK